MPRNLRLGATQNLDEVADTYLLVAHEVEQPEPSIVAERLKKAFHVERWCFRLPCVTYTH